MTDTDVVYFTSLVRSKCLRMVQLHSNDSSIEDYGQGAKIPAFTHWEPLWPDYLLPRCHSDSRHLYPSHAQRQNDTAQNGQFHTYRPDPSLSSLYKMHCRIEGLVTATKILACRLKIAGSGHQYLTLAAGRTPGDKVFSL
jgi:hypothetical protein